ncbi:GNAT family N-acetyltransferase [Streptacidiphilus neutrinimicus]|uniref:GNAT family N-acetyltransferase n=1 Tax=Streptacidiphilus neutrinimicus TaxID=105420 RepID=UPI0005A90023|nr:GNAT family N-acetyltransferase [Streptacidiphilus neutrinimicus]
MTTTLRPTGPERVDEHGSRERGYVVCVNGRTVGGIQLQASAAGSGRIRGLAIEERDRGRGRGTTAVLAAEEILRSWGCTRAEGSVVGAEGPEIERVLRWTRSLGYGPTARNMVKALPPVPPELPAGLTPRPLTAAEFTVWHDAQQASYAEMLVRHTGHSPEQAAAKSAADHAHLFPQGQHSPGVSIDNLLAGDEVVGTIWVSTLTADTAAEAGAGTGTDAGTDAVAEPRAAWVYNVKVREAFRGRGYGRALMLLAERVTLAAGLRELALNVHAGNVPAERLYESLGYRTFRWAVAKQL